ncbi:MAG: hypothetical protein AAF531_27280, partial [Actinomycetota bacterium]
GGAASAPQAGAEPSAAPPAQPADAPNQGGPAPSGPAAAARQRLSGATGAKAPPSPRAKRRGQDRSAPTASSPADNPPADNPQAAQPADSPPVDNPQAAQPAAADTAPPRASAPADAAPSAVDPSPDAENHAAAGQPIAETGGTPPAVSAAPTDTPAPAADNPAPAAADPTGRPDHGSTDAPPADDPQGQTGGRPALSSALTLASVTAAFDQQLDGVRQKVRVRFRSGRLLGVEGTTITFGATNPIHRDRCNEVKAEVEGAFSDHFGHPVVLDIVVDDAAPSPTMDPAKIESRPVTEITADEDVGPVEELRDATDQSANGLERLTKAFPGSTVVEPNPNQERP